ncbi:MAG: hypothetical protein VX951_14030 [Planctomycetota bacterium]|nr:hypothetical protein [Planctomycetota bacterium]
MSQAKLGAGGLSVLVLLAAHILYGLVRLPDKVWGRRLDKIGRYQDEGAARYLFGSAKHGGADEIEWLQKNVSKEAVVLWRHPYDGALEFVSALIAPRLLVDERCVPPGTLKFVERPVARGTLPSGDQGVLIVQGTEDGGLRLTVREN